MTRGRAVRDGEGALRAEITQRLAPPAPASPAKV
jgi:hypothetical protein